MWHKVALVALYLAGAVIFAFVALLISAKVWKRYKKARKILSDVSKTTGATLRLFSGFGEFRRVNYRFSLLVPSNKRVSLEIEATSPIRLEIIKKGFEEPLFSILKEVPIDNIEIASEYLIYSSNVREAQRWFHNFEIAEELLGVMNSGCYRLSLKKGKFQVYWSRLSQLELKYLPEWVNESIDRLVALKGILISSIKNNKPIHNPATWLHTAIFGIVFLLFATVYKIIKPLEIGDTLLTSSIMALPITLFFIYKIYHYTFRAKPLKLALSYILVSLSSTLFVASVIIFANSLFIDSEGEYKRVESLSSLHLSKNICIELIRFDGGESIINPTLICSKNRENIEATIYSGHLGYNFVSLQKRVVKLTLVDVYITLENGEPSQALNLVTRYIALNPEDIDGYYTRGKIEFKLQKYSKALQDMEKILDINPHYLKAYLEIDKILARVKRWEKIVEFWTRFTKLEPENPRGYLERAGAFYFWGKLDLAKKDLEKSCELGSIKGCREKRRLFK